MSTVLLDTTVASLLHPKKKQDALRAQYEPHMQGQILALSFQTVAELWAWAEENNWVPSGEKDWKNPLKGSLSFLTNSNLRRPGLK